MTNLGQIRKFAALLDCIDSDTALRLLSWCREDPMERRLAAILAADVVGYSRLMGEGPREAIASEPLMKHRKRIRQCRNRGLTRLPGGVRGFPEGCLSGVRCVGGAKLGQAVVRNVGICRSDAKGTVLSGSWARN